MQATAIADVLIALLRRLLLLADGLSMTRRGLALVVRLLLLWRMLLRLLLLSQGTARDRVCGS